MDDLSLPGQRRENLYPAGLQGFSSKWKALSKWMQSPDGKTEIAEAKKDAWVSFNQQFPNADKSEFVSQQRFSQRNCELGNIFQKRSWSFAKRVRIGQKILER